MSEEEQREDVEVRQGVESPFPTGAEVAGPGTVRQGTGYSGTTSGGVELGAGHDPDPYDPPGEGYMGGTTSSDEPAEEVIVINPNEE